MKRSELEGSQEDAEVSEWYRSFTNHSLTLAVGGTQ